MVIKSYSELVLQKFPTIYYRLGELSGTTVFSEVNAPLANGTLSGSFELGKTGALLFDENKAIQFSAGGRVDIPLAAFPVSNTNFVIEMWVRPQSNLVDTAIFNSTGAVGNPIRIILNIPNPYSITFQITGNNGVTQRILTAPNVIPESTWTYLVCAYQAGQISRIFINGILIQTMDFGSPLAPDPITIGPIFPQTTNIQIDEFAYYNGRILTPPFSSISTQYAASCR